MTFRPPGLPAHEPHILSSMDFGQDLAPDPLLRAMDWSELYRADYEYEKFWEWLDHRNDPMRPDRHEIMNRIPLEFSPEQVPPPLRRHFVNVFNSEG